MGKHLGINKIPKNFLFLLLMEELIMKIRGATINEINEVTDLIEKYGGALTLEELYWKLKKEHDEYFSDTY